MIINNVEFHTKEGVLWHMMFATKTIAEWRKDLGDDERVKKIILKGGLNPPFQACLNTALGK